MSGQSESTLSGKAANIHQCSILRNKLQSLYGTTKVGGGLLLLTWKTMVSSMNVPFMSTSPVEGIVFGLGRPITREWAKGKSMAHIRLKTASYETVTGI